MLQNFFRLNPGASDITSQSDFVNLTSQNDTVENVIYRPNNLSGASDTSKLKLKFITFENVSFKDTVFENVEFTNCHFQDCLFLGSKFIKCKFLECSFSGCNTLGITIEKSYLNPSFFSSNFKFNQYTKSNIAVQLFQELYNNSVQQDYSEFTKKAKYYLLLWEDKLLISKFFYNKPYPIKWYKFFYHFIPNSFFRFGFGYGFRLRNFIISFIIIFLGCFTCNKYYWAEYSLEKKDLAIQYFNPVKYSNYANLHYTTDVLTKAIDSQFQPSSNFGMILYSIQGCIGLVFFSLLITVLINKFVK